MIILTAYMDVPLKVSHKFFPIYLTFNLLDLYIIFLELYLFFRYNYNVVQLIF